MASGQTARERRRIQRVVDDAAVTMIPGSDLRASFTPLSDEETRKIHHAALKLLAEVGMANPTDRVQDAALRHGCTIDDDGRLLFPESLVEDCLAQASREFVVYGRNSRFDFEAKNARLNFCTGGAAISMLDSRTRGYRDSTLRDLYDLARLCDCLKNIQWFTRPVVATDMPSNFELDVNTVYACAAGTTKHIATSFTSGEYVYRIEPLLDALAGGRGMFAKRPFFTVHATTVVSPMSFAPDSLDVACAAVDIGMPIQCLTGPQAGATAPAALAGAVVQGCAETLASLSIINLLNPGHPVILGNWLMVSDLRTGAFSGGGPEQVLLGAAASQMSAFYGIPGGVGAGMSDSKLPDAQAGFEKALTIAFAALAGGGFVYESAGMLGSLLGCSFESMVIDDEMLAYVRRIARGIEVNDKTLSVAEVNEAVRGAGHFLGHQQTLELMEHEYTYPRQVDRLSPEDWRLAGSTDIWQRASEQAKQILDSNFPEYIDHQTDRKIRKEFPIRLASHTELRAGD